MILTCSKCFGNKTYRGMGSMIIKCEPCNGTGQVEISSVLPPAESTKTVGKEKTNAKEKKDGSQGKKG